MKTGRKMIAILVCVALLFSLSVVAYAASSAFFTDDYSGYRCTGRGSFSGFNATSSLSAEEIPDQLHIPAYDCTAYTWVVAYDSGGKIIGSENNTGTTYVSASFTGTRAVFSIGCGFTFNGFHFGFFRL